MPLPFIRTALSVSVLSLLASTHTFAAEDACGPLTASEEQVVNLQQENFSLTTRILELELQRGITPQQLKHKKVKRLKEIAADVRLQRQTTADFQGFVSWMSSNLVCYNKYIQAGSYAAVVARVLPIPYAGQASIFTKFLAQFTLALNNASQSINSYLNSSQKFIAMVDAIDPAGQIDQKAVADASNYADNHLLKEMNDAQLKLAAVADLSSGALSFLDSLNHYMNNTDEYWNKAKGLFKKDVDIKEKSFLSESSSNLKSQAAKFNGKLRSFEELGKKQTANVKSLAVYDEMMTELAYK